MRSRLSPRSCQKSKENQEVDRQELKQTLDQIKVLKVKTNNRIQQYERVNNQHLKKILDLEQQLLSQTLKNQQLTRANEETEGLKLRVRDLEGQNGQLSGTLEEKTYLIDFLRKQTQEFQKKYFRIKEELQICQGQKGQTEGQLQRSRQQIEKASRLLGIDTLSKLGEIPFLEHFNLLTYTTQQRELKQQALNNVGLLNMALADKQNLLQKAQQQAWQLKQLLSLAKRRSHILEESDQMMKEAQTQLKEELAEVQETLSKAQDQVCQLKFQFQQSIVQLQDQCQIVSQYRQREQAQQRQAEIRREYSLLVQEALNQKQGFSSVNAQLQTLRMYKAQHVSNIDKIKFLCSQIDSS